MNTSWWILILVAAVGLPLLRLRNEPLHRVAFGVAGGLLIASALALALTWAGIDVGRLGVALTLAIIAVLVAAGGVVVSRLRIRNASRAGSRNSQSRDA
jgi:high-affinity Fe2+/Pb2+ permease